MTQPPEILDIVALVTNNPLTKLTDDYESKIIKKIRERFTNDNQQLFVGNFYCYLNYNTTTDFIINLDHIWKWLGYSRIDPCKVVLVKNFKIDIDYKIENFAPEISGAKTEPVHNTEKMNKIYFPEDAGEKTEHLEEPKETRGGYNKEYITLTINCFKKLCLKSKTTKADQIHDYYIQLEEIMNEIVSEQSEELKHKLLIKDLQIEELIKSNLIEITKLEENLITISMNKKLVYLGLSEKNIVKFGFSKGIDRRVLKEHKKEIGPQFTLKYIIYTENHIDLEDLIKKECKREGSVLFGRRISKKYNGKNQIELIKLDENFTIDDLYAEVLNLKDLCTDDFMTKLIEENNKLKSTLYKEHIPKPDIITNDEIKQVLSDGIKCATCAKISEPAKIGINKITGQYYSQCVNCRKKYSDLKMAKNEENRNQKEKEMNNKELKINQLREQLLSGTNIVKCFKCKKEKLSIDIGINKITNQLYKTCNLCRGVKIETITEPECSKCHKHFEIEYNEISRSNYKTCKLCREKYQNLKEKNELENAETDTIECIYCHKNKPKEMNAKKDGFYKSCTECRETRKKYDKKKNEVHRETILSKKKEHYQEKKEEIRIVQKEYYDQNREYILASKAKTIQE
jgi:hypothetical protein